MWGQRVGGFVGGVTLLIALGAAAQGRPSLSVSLPSADSLATAGPVVHSRQVLADRSVRELMDHGFPARLRYRVELWSTSGWFDRQLRAVQWDVVVRYDPLHKTFEAVRVNGDTVSSLGVFRQFQEVAAEVELPQRAAITAPTRQPPAYYNVTLTLEMLSVSDLDELQRWVKGDLRPVVRGQRNPGTALSRGTRTLLSRLLGGERRTLEVRSEPFVVR